MIVTRAKPSPRPLLTSTAVETAVETLIGILDKLDAPTEDLEPDHENGWDNDDESIFWHDREDLEPVREQVLGWVRSLQERRAAGRPVEAPPEPEPEPLPILYAERDFIVEVDLANLWRGARC